MEVDALLRGLHLKDLRAQLRIRGQNPGGGQEELRVRLKEMMVQTGDFNIYPENGAPQQQQQQMMPQQMQQMQQQQYQGMPPQGYGGGGFSGEGTGSGNNYSRPGGQQNVGNFLSDRPSSRVLAPPGGQSQIVFGGGSDAPPPQARQPQQYQQQQASPYAQGNYPPQAPYAGKAQQPSPYGDSYSNSPMQGSSSAYGSGTKDHIEGHLQNNYSRPNGMQNVGNFITDRPSSKVLAPPGGKSQISFG